MYHDGAGCKISECGCRKKGKEFRGEGKAPYDIPNSQPNSFGSISETTDWLVRLSIVTIILTAISLAFITYKTISVPSAVPLADFQGVIDSLSGLITFAAFIIKLLWYYRATQNVLWFGAKDVVSPIMAAIWWLIPIFFFWKPYHVTQQIWKTSNPELNMTDGTEWTKTSSSKLIMQWWTLELVSIAGIVLGLIIGHTINLPFLQNLTTVPFEVVNIFSIILFIRIIRQISSWQELKSNSLKTT